MDIYLWIDNGRDIIRLPVLPSEFEMVTGHNNETYETVMYGEINLIGRTKLATCSINSFFPDQDSEYSFARDKSLSGIQYAQKILDWKEQRLPVRLIIPDLDINMAATIEQFKYGADSSKDIPYSLDLKEFRFPQIKVNPLKNKKG